jgi:hypothetical protein
MLKGSSLFLATALGVTAATINVNPGFEEPLILGATPSPYQVFDPLIKSYLQADVPGWTTTDSRGAIEIWRTGAQGFSAFRGSQWAEINAYSPATLTTVVTPPAGSRIGIEFAHRGRGSATTADVMRAVVTDLGLNLASSVDDVILLNTVYSATNAAWVFHAVNFGLASGNTLRLDLTAVSTAGGNPSVGNFVDAVTLGETESANVPEPSAGILIAAGLAALTCGHKTARRSAGRSRQSR